MATVRLTAEQCRRDDLPDVCAKCGRADTQRVEHTFVWFPAWVWVFLVVGGPPVLVVAYFFARKKWRMRVPMCEWHARHWAGLSLYARTGLWAFLGLFVVGIAMSGRDGPTFALVGVLGFAVCLILVAFRSTSLVRATLITRDDIFLTGVSQQFAAAADRGDNTGRSYHEHDDPGPRHGRNRYEGDAE